MNALTSSHTDLVTDTPAFKEASVRMEVLPEVGESPLPRINSRFGHPTPQQGVEVERKWTRSDYRVPGTTVAAHAEGSRHHGSADSRSTRRRAIRARRSAPGSSARRTNTPRRCWPPTTCCSSSTIAGSSTSSEAGWPQATSCSSTVVDGANTPEAVRALRNLLFWRSVLGRIEPEWFQGIFQAIPDGLADGHRAAR